MKYSSFREPASINYFLISQRMGKGSEEWLREQRAKGYSYGHISRLLHSYGIEVSDETLRQWCKRLGIPGAPIA